MHSCMPLSEATRSGQMRHDPVPSPDVHFLIGVAPTVKPASLTLSLPSAFHSRSCAVHSPRPGATHSHPGTWQPHP
jgi:hypothetical protein